MFQTLLSLEIPFTLLANVGVSLQTPSIHQLSNTYYP
jgi:hypothetical protein